MNGERTMSGGLAVNCDWFSWVPRLGRAEPIQGVWKSQTISVIVRPFDGFAHQAYWALTCSDTLDYLFKLVYRRKNTDGLGYSP